MILYVVAIGVALLLYAIDRLTRPPQLDFDGAHVVVTGGSQGIGKALATNAARLGARVTLVARNATTLAEAKKDVEKVARRPVHVATMDVCDSYETIATTIRAIEAEQGAIDVLVNNAGRAAVGEFDRLPIDAFDDMMNLNYLGAVKVTRAAVERMKRGSRIAFVSSQAGQIGLYGYTAYSPSKAALRSFAEALQMELLPRGVYVSVSFPPDTDTPGLAEENKTKPTITKLISATSGVFSADAVSRSMISGIRKGAFHIWFGLDGFMLNFLTTGMAPVHHLGTALVQVCTMSLCRLVSLFYLYDFNKLVKRQVAREKEKDA